MILDQTIGSARAEKHKNPVAHRIVRNLLTAVLASALTLPSLAAWGMDSSPKQAAAKTGDMLPLPQSLSISIVAPTGLVLEQQLLGFVG